MFESSDKEIIFGRRGPVQAGYTQANEELIELNIYLNTTCRL